MTGPGEREVIGPLGFGAVMPAIVCDIDGSDTEGGIFENSIRELTERKTQRETKRGRIAPLNN
jgi:hypothetical protein